MKKSWQIIFSVILYIFIVACALDFNIFLLIDIRLIFLTLVGTLLLTLPYYEEGISRRELLYIFGRKSIDTGFIQTFLLLFARLQNEAGYNRLLGDIALCFRPLLYGFCLFILLTEREDTQDAKQPDTRGQSTVFTKIIRTDTASDPADDAQIIKTDAAPGSFQDDTQIIKTDAEPRSFVDDAQIHTDIGQEISNDTTMRNTADADSVVLQITAQKKTGIHEFASIYALTRRETEITQLIIQGKSNAMIAGELFISETTVKKHVSNIFDKTGVSRREELIVRVRED